METKDYMATMRFAVIGCRNKADALEQFIEVVERGDFAASAFTLEEIEKKS